MRHLIAFLLLAAAFIAYMAGWGPLFFWRSVGGFRPARWRPDSGGYVLATGHSSRA